MNAFQSGLLLVAFLPLLTGCETPSLAPPTAPLPIGSDGGEAIRREPAQVVGEESPGQLDLSCSTVDDCAKAELSLEGEHVCCDSCAEHAANKAWLEKFQKWCETGPACLPIQCGEAPLRRLSCADGKCVME